MDDAIWITQAEAAALLGLTPGGLIYVTHTRRLLKGRRRGGRMFYALDDVDRLRQQRAREVKTGRPSGRDLLQRRFHCAPRDIVQPYEGGDFPLSGGLPLEHPFTGCDDGNV